MAAPTGLGISGFWGLILEPGKRYSKLVDVPFHITAAVLDTLSSGPKKEDDTVSVMLEVDGMEIIICNLSRKLGILQFPLNLRFEEGSRIAFYSTGTGTNIHLSGNILGSKGDFSSFAAKVSDKFTQNKRKNDAEDAKSTKKAKKIPDMPAHQKMRQILNSIDIDDEADGYDSEDEETESDLSEEEEEEEEDEEESEEELTPKIEQVQKTPASKAVNELPKKKKKKKDKIKQEVVATTPSKESVTKTPGQKTPAKTPNAEVSAKTPSKVNTPNNKAGSMNGKSPKQKTPEAKNVAAPSQNKSPKVVKMGGVTCEDLRVGTGTEAVLGKNTLKMPPKRTLQTLKMPPKRTFRDAWLLDDRFREWLRRVEGNPKQAFCQACKKTIKADITSVKRHKISAVHSRSLQHLILENDSIAPAPSTSGWNIKSIIKSEPR